MYALQAMHLFILFCFSSSIQLKIAQTIPEYLSNSYIVNGCTRKGSVAVQEALQGSLAGMLDLMQCTSQIFWALKQHRSLRAAEAIAACLSGKKADKVKNVWAVEINKVTRWEHLWSKKCLSYQATFFPTAADSSKSWAILAYEEKTTMKI